MDVASRALRSDPWGALTAETSGSLAEILGQDAGPSREPRGSRVEWSKIRLDAGACRVFWDGKDVGLTIGQYRIVQLLASQPGIHVTYRAIYDHVRGKGFAAGDGPNGYRGTVRSAIKHIRKKFCACDPDFDQIKNYSGFGYCWRETSRAVTDQV